eukprot:CAMPEP_0115013542 /NCGR_PEP_ID=MMETSP0216-20121206/25480_1 /TAXON_ID=223996 /ORGANISM="Protocruzia adherens, Strain Boccale" /LENGTH=170 /DNA_ID=CAMNT_0002382981 /DNA_START=90 /DNA_END=602 /DNA_ORIENTATION=+
MTMHKGHGDNNGPMVMEMRMQMTFKASTEVTLLFDGLKTETTGQYVAALIVIFFICVVFQYAMSLVSLISRKIYSTFGRHSQLTDGWKEGQTLTTKDAVPTKVIVFVKLLTAVFYTGIFMLAYGIMLLAMTFNVGVFLTMCAGLAVGHVLFQDSPSQHFNSQGKDLTGCH